MKKVGIALIIIEIVIIISGIATNQPFWSMLEGEAPLTGGSLLLGYFLPAIIGIVLIYKANKKND